MAKICPNCKEENPSAAKFCMHCQTLLVEENQLSEADILRKQLADAKEQLEREKRIKELEEHNKELKKKFESGAIQQQQTSLQTTQEQVDVVELFDENGESFNMKLIATVKHAGKDYLVLTLFFEDEYKIDSNIPAEVFIMHEEYQEGNEKQINPVEDAVVVEQVYTKFKKENGGNYILFDGGDSDNFLPEKQQEAETLLAQANQKMKGTSLTTAQKDKLAIAVNKLNKVYKGSDIDAIDDAIAEVKKAIPPPPPPPLRTFLILLLAGGMVFLASHYKDIIPLIKSGIGNQWEIGYPHAANVIAKFNEGTLTISGNGAMKDWANEVDKPWNSIKNNIKNVVIYDGVTSIGTYAFTNCGNLATVSIPYSITSIERWAFKNTALSTVSLPDGITYIGDYAFENCVTSINIPSSLKVINEGVFWNSKLTSIEIPNSITSIGNRAFEYNVDLQIVNIPNSVASIGTTAFMNCTSLTDISVNWKKPLSIPINTFQNVKTSKIKLHVPSGSQSAYDSAPIWKNFKIVKSATTNNSATSTQQTTQPVTKTTVVSSSPNSQVQTIDYNVKADIAMSHAIEAWNAKQWENAYQYYKEAANYPTANSDIYKQRGANKFKEKAETIIANNNGECDAFAKQLLEFAYKLKPTNEINNLLKKCN